MQIARLVLSRAPAQYGSVSHTSRAAYTFYCRAYQTRVSASPIEETENVRSLVNLASLVRDKDAKNQDGRVRRTPSRLNTRSWADEAKSRSLGKDASLSSSMTLDPALEKLLLEPKSMMSSYVELSLPFRSSPELLERYIASSGGIRLGKVFEDLDTLSGTVSYEHVLGGRPNASARNPIFIVTASVDRLDLLEQLSAEKDYTMCGMVIYVGSSSMEVLVTVDELDDKGKAVRTCLTGRFTMATRNAQTGKSQKIPPLKLDSKPEKDLFAMGQAHKERKALESQTSLEKVPPTSEEAALLHRLWLADHTLSNTSSVVSIADTALQTTSHMHPQQRNVHMKVFGGYLIRSSYELAWMAAALHANQPVTFLSLDALSFHLPISIGALLSLSSNVTYTSNIDSKSDDRVIASVVVVAEIVDVETGKRDRSNTFHYSFDLGNDKKHKRVIPESYSDSMSWIEGRRVELGNEVRKSYVKG